MPKIFSSFLSGFDVISKKKKGHRADGDIFKKKKTSSEFCKFSPRFVLTVFGRKQKRQFLAREKTPEFAKFQCEKAGKHCALFAIFCTCKEHWVPPLPETPPNRPPKNPFFLRLNLGCQFVLISGDI